MTLTGLLEIDRALLRPTSGAGSRWPSFCGSKPAAPPNRTPPSKGPRARGARLPEDSPDGRK